MKKAVSLIFCLSLLLTAFAVTSQAVEVIPVMEEVQAGNTYQLQLLQYNTMPSNTRQLILGNIADFILTYVPITSNPIDQKMYGISFRSNDTNYNGMEFTYEIDQNLNLPCFTVYYGGMIWNGSSYSAMHHQVISFVRQTNGTYQITFANQNLFQFYVYGGDEYKSDELIVYFTSCCGMIYEPPTTDNNIISDIEQDQVQQEFVTFYLTQFPSVTVAVGALLEIASSCIFNTQINTIIQFIIFGGMTILIFRLFMRVSGGGHIKDEK